MDGLVVGHLIVLSALVASVAANFLLASGFHSGKVGQLCL